MDANTRQEHVLWEYSVRVAGLAPSPGTPQVLAALVREAIGHPFLFRYSEILTLPVIQSLKDTDFHWCLDMLCVFAYGSLKDYNKNQQLLPNLLPQELNKIRQLTLVTLLEVRHSIPLTHLKDELAISNTMDLGNFLNSCHLLGITTGNWDLTSGTYEAESVQHLRGSLSIGQSLHTFLLAAVVPQTDAVTGLMYNDLVTQVHVPLDRFDKSKFCIKVDFKLIGSEIFGQLIFLVTDGHLSMLSWNGLLFPGMFVIVGRQILLRPGATPRNAITGPNSLKDYSSVEDMLRTYTGLRFQHIGKDGTVKHIMYPVYMENLCLHLRVMPEVALTQRTSPNIITLDKNFITFVRCHPSLLMVAARSVLLFHVKKHYNSSTSTDQTDFTTVVNSMTMKVNWRQNLEHDWLFKQVFTHAWKRGNPYGFTPAECHRCMRDWETHGREKLTTLQRLVFTVAIFTYLVEHHLDDFLPQLLYFLLCGYSETHADCDFREWVSSLHRVSKLEG